MLLFYPSALLPESMDQDGVKALALPSSLRG